MCLLVDLLVFIESDSVVIDVHKDRGLEIGGIGGLGDESTI